MAKKNKHQKAAHKEGEERIGREELQDLLKLSHSADPKDRETAASFLCPCHVRRRVDEAWDALYRMMEDENFRVRRQAWHTMEDGGRPDDPRLEEIINRRLEVETDKGVLAFVKQFAGNYRQREDIEIKAAGCSDYTLTGKCDFCGKSNTKVKRDLETTIPDRGETRAALVCENCDQVPA
jgi:hypothetical protein